MPLESRLKRTFVTQLKMVPHSKVLDLHRSGYGEKGVPDTEFLVLGIEYRCYVFFLEFKRDESKKAEKLQKHRLKELRATGATAVVVRDWPHIRHLVWAVLRNSQRAALAQKPAWKERP